MYDDMTDEALMFAYQLGEYGAFERLYFRYSGRAFGYLLKRVGSEAIAKDILQNAFLKLHRNRTKFKRPFSSWFFTLLKNEMIDEMRRQKRRQEILTADFSEVPPPVPSNTDTVSLEGVDGRSKKILEMRFEKDLSFDVMANLLKTTPVNARKLVSRAIKKLRRSYGNK